MNKRILFISVTFIVSSIFLTGATHKYESPACITSAVPELVNKISGRLGIQLTVNDNIALYEYINQWIGTPYRRGGRSKNGVDCSGFTLNVYENVYEKHLVRSSADILRVNCEKVDKKDLKEGDLVFFWTRGQRSERPSHVGVYLKDGKFVHSSTSNGVIISSLNEPYYSKRWISGGLVK